MAEIQLIGADQGRVAVFCDVDDATLTITAIRGTNRSGAPVTVVIDNDAASRNTKVTLAPGASVEQRTSIPTGRRIQLSERSGQTGRYNGIVAYAMFPGESA